MKASIIGGGNIGMALAEGLINSLACEPADITITRRNLAALESIAGKALRQKLIMPKLFRTLMPSSSVYCHNN